MANEPQFFCVSWKAGRCCKTLLDEEEFLKEVGIKVMVLMDKKAQAEQTTVAFWTEKTLYYAVSPVINNPLRTTIFLNSKEDVVEIEKLRERLRLPDEEGKTKSRIVAARIERERFDEEDE